jgi:phosphodiesterase/alkaline phosphatase D-like protein
LPSSITVPELLITNDHESDHDASSSSDDNDDDDDEKHFHGVYDILASNERND